MAREDEAELQRLLKERLELVNSDPTYEGADPTSQDQLVLAIVGLVIPAILMIGGWASFPGSSGGYRGTPVAGILPFRLALRDDRPKGAAGSLRLTEILSGLRRLSLGLVAFFVIRSASTSEACFILRAKSCLPEEVTGTHWGTSPANLSWMMAPSCSIRL